MRCDETLANELARLGGLDSLSLRQRWTKLFDVEPSPRISRDLLIRAIAWRLQEEVHGGLNKTAQRQLAEHAAGLRSSRSMSVSSGADYKPGTKLIREWQGKVHEVVILDDGYIWSALSRCRTKDARILRLAYFQATATAARHVFIAAARKPRCVWADVRWRWTLKML